MRPVSAAFIRSLSGTHQIAARATLCPTFQTGVSPVGDVAGIQSGVVTLDSKSDVRGSADVTLVGVNWPIFSNDLLAPYGQEVYLQRGIKYDDNTVEYVGLGYFRIDTVDQVDPNSGVVRLTAYDRMQAIVEARLLVPRQFLSGTTFGVVVDNLITEIYPDAVIEWDDTTDLATLTRDVICEEDRFMFLNEAIAARGKIWYWDHRGVLVIKDIPSFEHPVYEVRHGENGVLVDFNRALTRAGAINAMIVTGDSGDTEEPVRGIAIDNDVNSPTYFFGRFGQVPEFFASSFLTTDEQCETAAVGLLQRKLGLPYTINFGTIVNPALEPYDPVLIKYSHAEAWTIQVLDTVSVPFDESTPLGSTTREVRVQLIGTTS